MTPSSTIRAYYAAMPGPPDMEPGAAGRVVHATRIAVSERTREALIRDRLLAAGAGETLAEWLPPLLRRLKVDAGPAFVSLVVTRYRRCRVGFLTFLDREPWSEDLRRDLIGCVAMSGGVARVASLVAGVLRLHADPEMERRRLASVYYRSRSDGPSSPLS